ncbi:hypothetical protein OXX79_003642 [Metschnikowia pulcherrima]
MISVLGLHANKKVFTHPIVPFRPFEETKFLCHQIYQQNLEATKESFRFSASTQDTFVAAFRNPIQEEKDGIMSGEETAESGNENIEKPKIEYAEAENTTSDEELEPKFPSLESSMSSMIIGFSRLAKARAALLCMLKAPAELGYGMLQSGKNCIKHAFQKTVSGSSANSDDAELCGPPTNRFGVMELPEESRLQKIRKWFMHDTSPPSSRSSDAYIEKWLQNSHRARGPANSNAGCDSACIINSEELISSAVSKEPQDCPQDPNLDDDELMPIYATDVAYYIHNRTHSAISGTYSKQSFAGFPVSKEYTTDFGIPHEAMIPKAYSAFDCMAEHVPAPHFDFQWRQRFPRPRRSYSAPCGEIFMFEQEDQESDSDLADWLAESHYNETLDRPSEDYFLDTADTGNSFNEWIRIKKQPRLIFLALDLSSEEDSWFSGLNKKKENEAEDLWSLDLKENKVSNSNSRLLSSSNDGMDAGSSFMDMIPVAVESTA